MSSRQHVPCLVLLVLSIASALSPQARAGGAENALAVTTTADNFDAFDQKCSLREALANANGNFALSPVVGECPTGSGSETDVIVLQSGETYTLSLQGNNDHTGDLDVLDDPFLPDDDTDLRIATSDMGLATIRQSVAGERVIQITKARIEITNIVLQDGNIPNEHGGGLLFEGVSLVLDRVSVTGNKTGWGGLGGGIAIMGGAATLIDSHVSYNIAGVGGGIFTLVPTVLRRTIVQGNTASDGGGIYMTSTLTVEDASQFILNTSAASGGGIYAFGDDASLEVSDALFEKNTSGSFGGAVSAELLPVDDTARVSFVDSTFVDNESGTWGGAISSLGIEITGGQFINNRSVLGGAVFADLSPLHVANTSFIGNKTGNNGQGGAIYAHSIRMENCALEQNASAQGGALFVTHHLDTSDSRFALNTAADGGALYLLGQQNAPHSTVVRSLFRNNIAQMDGGAVWTKMPSLTIANTTISANSVASGTGSGLFVQAGGAVTAINATLAWNAPGVSVAKFGDLTLKNSIVTSPDTIDCEASQNNPLILSLGNNLSDDNSCFGLNAPSDKTNIDVMLAPLTDNGGNTLTHTLLDGSPAIDAGDGIACTAEPVADVDQRGATRQSGLNCDIGAFEKAVATDPKPIELFRDEFESP